MHHLSVLRTVSRPVILVPFLCAVLAILAGIRHARAAPPHLSSVQHVQVGTMNMGYRVGGTGFPLVMVMGRGGTMADWDPALISLLMRNHRVVLFDNRGVGTTNNPSTATLTVSQMATDTVGLMHALHFARADLLGWSMGGYVAQTVTLQHPTMVRRLVLAATDPGGTHTTYPASSVQKVLDNPHLNAATLLSLCFPPDRAGLGGAIRYLRRVATQPGLVRHSFTFTNKAKINQEAATAQWKATTGGDYAWLPTIRQPTLVADGRGDLVVPIANAYLLARRIPRTRLLVYPNAGHAFLFQDATRFGTDVTTFLQARR